MKYAKEFPRIQSGLGQALSCLFYIDLTGTEAETDREAEQNSKVYMKNKSLLTLTASPQHAQWTLNEIEKTFDGLLGLKSMHQELRIYFVCNPRLKAIETASYAAWPIWPRSGRFG